LTVSTIKPIYKKQLQCI